MTTTTTGSINGGDGNDLIYGDPGAVTTVTSGSTANVVLVLDTSASMDWALGSDSNPTGNQPSRLDLLEQAVTNLINTMAASHADDLRVKIIGFDTNSYNVGSGANSNGVYNFIVDGVVNTAAVNAAISAINGLNTDAGTNYEAGLGAATNYMTSSGTGSPIADADVNKVLFISDGQPTSYLNGATTVVSGARYRCRQRRHSAGAGGGHRRHQRVQRPA